MSTGSPSFWSRFKQIDAQDASDDLLGYLDAVARLPPVRAAKVAATAALGLVEGDRALDLGCGTGVDLADMATAVLPGGHVTGVDLSAEAVRVAAERHADNAGIDVQVGDAHVLPFADGAFDACRADRTLQHLQRPEVALAELRRVLVSGGRLVILEMSAELEVPSEMREHPVTHVVSGGLAKSDERRSWLTFMLPLLLSRAGFGRVAMESGRETCTGLDIVDTALRMRETIDAAIEDGELTVGQVDEWSERAAAADERFELRLGFVRLATAADDARK